MSHYKKKCPRTWRGEFHEKNNSFKASCRYSRIKLNIKRDSIKVHFHYHGHESRNFNSPIPSPTSGSWSSGKCDSLGRGIRKKKYLTQFRNFSSSPYLKTAMFHFWCPDSTKASFYLRVFNTSFADVRLHGIRNKVCLYSTLSANPTVNLTCPPTT